MIYTASEEKPARLNQLKALGYATFEKHDYDLNLIGIRSKNRRADAFDDVFLCIYKEKGLWIQERYKCTVDAGAYWLENPSRSSGTAILKAGQYRGVWKLDLHKGIYQALCQRGAEVTVWRDDNKDLIHDHRQQETGWFGINCHRANQWSIVDQVGKYSAGCTVIQHPADFARLIVLCKMQQMAGLGHTYTYTLLED